MPMNIGKRSIIALCFVLALGLPRTMEAQESRTTAPLPYDSLKAAAYGADDYGMKRYVMAFLKRGPNRDIPQDSAARLQQAHLANIIRMAEAGQLVMAGPFLDTGSVRGIYIFDVKTTEEAEALTNTDPAIKAGSLMMDLRPWYGPAALLEISRISETLSQKKITER